MNSAALAVLPEHWEIIQTLLKTHLPVGSKVFAFGSRVTGRHRKYSDLDLLIDAGRPLTLDQSADLQDDLTESDLPWKVDVIDQHKAHDYFLRLIKSDLTPIFLYPENNYGIKMGISLKRTSSCRRRVGGAFYTKLA